LFDAVPFYAGLTLEEIGGRGVRWQERAGAAAFPDPVEAPGEGAVSRATASTASPNGATNGTATPDAAASIWDTPEVEFSPSLKFLYRRAGQAIEPTDVAGGGTPAQAAAAGGER
jgi:NADH-quinone oxidoreductase subunit G